MAAALAALISGKPSGVPTAVRTRSVSLQETDLPALTIYPKEDRPKVIGGRGGPIEARILSLAVECEAAEGSGKTADQAADPLVKWSKKSLKASRNLGGLALFVAEEKTIFDYELVGQKPACRATVLFSIEYQTRTDDPELKT